MAASDAAERPRERERAGEQRDSAAHLRDYASNERDHDGDQRDDAAHLRDDAGDERDEAGDRRDEAADLRDHAGDQRDEAGGRRDLAAQSRDDAAQLAETSSSTLAIGRGHEAARLARAAAADDRMQSSIDRRAGTTERNYAGQDRGLALADRGAGARDRGVAERDRGDALADRGAGAVSRSAAEFDRGFASTDRGAAERDRLRVAQGIRFRMGLAAENAELYARQRSFSEALQRSLLTVPPQTAHFEIAVRYVPATREEEVGGDWYDAFSLASGETVIAIGDVMGHDIQAAMAMAQLRGLLRGIGFTTGDTPAFVLTRLDEAVSGLAIHTMATALVARLERVRHDDDEPPESQLRWSNAGHPPALLVDVDGHVRALGCGEDLLLGVDARSPRNEGVEVLRPGSTVLLYTDGLVERRGEHLDEGIAQLMSIMGSTCALPVEQMCDEVLIQLLEAFNEDDIALLAVRVLPGDS